MIQKNFSKFKNYRFLVKVAGKRPQSFKMWDTSSSSSSSSEFTSEKFVFEFTFLSLYIHKDTINLNQSTTSTCCICLTCWISSRSDFCMELRWYCAQFWISLMTVADLTLMLSITLLMSNFVCFSEHTILLHTCERQDNSSEKHATFICFKNI